MTSDGGYPSFTDDLFGQGIDRDRCSARHEGRRCQLYDHHADAHAHGWNDVSGPGRIGRRQPRPWNPCAIRWNERGDVWDHEWAPIGWACLFRE